MTLFGCVCVLHTRLFYMQVIFVRHAQSINNVIQEGLTRADFESKRSHDADLSELGFKQADQLGKGIERSLIKRRGPRARELLKKSGQTGKAPRVHVAVSPMKRTLLTSIPMIGKLQEMHDRSEIVLAEIEINPFIFEVGGCYNEKDGIFVGHPGMSGTEAKQFLPMAKIHDEMKNGWWPHATKESEEQFEARVVKTMEWIKKMACSGTRDVLIIVSHQDFASTCMRRLAEVQGINWLYNTSLSALTLIPIDHSEADPEATQTSSDGTIRDLHHCRVVIDWINSVDHLSLDNIF